MHLSICSIRFNNIKFIYDSEPLEGQYQATDALPMDIHCNISLPSHKPVKETKTCIMTKVLKETECGTYVWRKTVANEAWYVPFNKVSLPSHSLHAVLIAISTSYHFQFIADVGSGWQLMLGKMTLQLHTLSSISCMLSLSQCQVWQFNIDWEKYMVTYLCILHIQVFSLDLFFFLIKTLCVTLR